MFKGKVTININPAEIARKRDIKSAQFWLASAVAKDSDPFVPYRTGMLASSPLRDSQFKGGKVVYAEPYAKKVYEGINYKFSRDKHPMATHHWFERAKTFFLDRWGLGVAKLLGGKWSTGG